MRKEKGHFRGVLWLQRELKLELCLLKMISHISVLRRGFRPGIINILLERIAKRDIEYDQMLTQEDF